MMANPLVIKFTASNPVITRVHDLYEKSIAKFETRKLFFDDCTEYECYQLTMLITEVTLWSCMIGVYCCTAIAGTVLYPWAGFALWFWFLAMLSQSEDDECNCTEIKDDIDPFLVETEELRRVNPQSLRESLKRLTSDCDHCLLFLVITNDGWD